MSEDTRDLGQKLAELRTAFDQTFARPAADRSVDMVQFAMIKAGGQRYAIRIHELAGLEANRRIVPVPANLPGLMGLSAVQGQLVPVFELAALLGEGVPSARPAPSMGDSGSEVGDVDSARWIALYRATEVVGFAFEDFEGSRPVAKGDVHDLEAQPHALSRQAIPVDSGVVHVLELARVAAALGTGHKPE